MKNPWLGAATAAAAIALLVLGTLSQRWLVGVDFGIESRVGLRSLELCQEVEAVPGEATPSCEAVSLDALGAASSVPDGFGRFHTLATAAFWAGLIAAGLLALALALVRRPLDLAVHPTTLAILASCVALALGGLVMVLNPYTKLVGWGSGPGFVLYGLGAALGLFAAVVLGRARPQVPDDWD